MALDDLDLAVLRARTGEKWREFPDDVLPAWVADMDFPVAEPVRRVLARMLEVGDTGYPLNPTPDALPRVFAERMEKRFDWKVDPHRVEVITDVVQGLYVGLLVYSEPGDGVVIQTPIYPPFLHAAAETERRAIENPFVSGTTGFELDLEGLDRQVDARTRILMLCNPHNPTGRVLTRAELEALAERALRHDWIVLSDEIHADLVYTGARHIPFASLSKEVEARTVTLTSASKAFNIAGLRCAFAAFGSEELQQRFNSLPRHVRGGIGSLGMAATRAAYEEGQPWLDEVLAYLEANRDFTAEFVRNELPGIVHSKPDGTYLAWLDCRALELGNRPQRFFLERARVALSDGAAFGRAGRGFARLNFATSRPLLREILERVARALHDG